MRNRLEVAVREIRKTDSQRLDLRARELRRLDGRTWPTSRRATDVPIWRGRRGSSGDVRCVSSVRRGQEHIGRYGGSALLVRTRRPPCTRRPAPSGLVRGNDNPANLLLRLGEIADEGLVMAKVSIVWPDAVAGHIEPIGHRPAPLRCLRGFAPVVGDAHGFPVF